MTFKIGDRVVVKPEIVGYFAPMFRNKIFKIIEIGQQFDFYSKINTIGFKYKGKIYHHNEDFFIYAPHCFYIDED